MCRVRAKQTMDAVLRPLLTRLVTLGMRRKLLLLDRGFYSVRGIQDLITGTWPFIMPAVKRGKKPTTVGGPTGTYALAETKQGQWTTYTLKSANWLQVLGATELAQIDQRVRHQFHAIVPLLDTFKS
jgi:hypothetical protein